MAKTSKIEGDYELVTEKCPVPVKLTVARLPSEWLLAVMIPKGNMVTCSLKEEGGSFELIRFNKGERETPLEIVETEHQVAEFLKKGVNMITREGDQLKLEEAGGESMLFQVDKRCQELLARPC
jgi:hypothetical protein